MVRTESGNYNSIYQFLHSFSPLYILKRPLSGEDYVMNLDGVKVELPLDDAKKLLFDYEGDSDILFDDKFLKWNLSNKNLGQWDTENPENFDTSQESFTTIPYHMDLFVARTNRKNWLATSNT